MPILPSDEKPKKTVGLRLDVSPDTRDDLRMAAAVAGVPMSVYLRRLVLREMKPWRERRQRK